jgi:hypothetical protein
MDFKKAICDIKQSQFWENVRLWMSKLKKCYTEIKESTFHPFRKMVEFVVVI